MKTTLYTAVSIDIDAYYWDTQGVATFFSWCQVPGVPGPEQISNSRQAGLNLCQMPGGFPEGMGTLGFDSYINVKLMFNKS